MPSVVAHEGTELFLHEVRLVASPGGLGAVHVGLACPLLTAHVGIGRSGQRRPQLIAVAAGVGDMEVVFGVLIEIFDSDTIVADCSFPCERNVPPEELICAAADFKVGPLLSKVCPLRSLLLLLERPASTIAPAADADLLLISCHP